METTQASRKPFPWHWLFLGLCAIYLFMLGAMPLNNPDEGRYAEIPREMVASGDWVSPRLNDTVYFEKPPLVYWANAISLKVFGPHEWAMRLVPVAFAFLGLGLTVVAARRLASPRAGWLAGILLASCVLYFALARILILDMAVSVLISGTLFCFILGIREPAGGKRRLWFYGLYTFAALATLAKGLIGFMLPGAVMFLWLLLFNQWRRLLPLYLPTGLLLFLAIALPWHLLAAEHNPQWANFYFVHEHWLRFTTSTHSRTAPFWYFVPILLLGLIPWTGLLVPTVQSLLREGWAKRHQHLETWFLLLWAAFIFLFFSRSQSKLAPYILPIFPALAVMIATWLDRAFESEDRSRLRLGLIINGAFLAIVVLALAVIAVKPGLIRQKDIADVIRPYAIGLAAVLAFGIALGVHFLRRQALRSTLISQALTMGALLIGVCLVSPMIVKRNTRELAAVVNQRFTEGDVIYHYRGFFHDFLFYSGRTVGTVDCENELELDIDPKARTSGRFITEAEFLAQWEGPHRLWVVARKSEVRSENPKETKLFDRPGFKANIIAENAQHVLFSNKP
jgi:4-amino-4-deoxy-L-arabinose transferase-like glycosyltransferase